MSQPRHKKRRRSPKGRTLVLLLLIALSALGGNGTLDGLIARASDATAPATARVAGGAQDPPAAGLPTASSS